MIRCIAASLLIALPVLGDVARAAETPDAPQVRVHSPNGQVRIEVFLQRHQEAEAAPHYRVFFRDQPIILASRMSIDLADGPPLGGACLIESVATRSHRAEYIVAPGAQGAVGHDMGSGPIRPSTPLVVDIFPRDNASAVYTDMKRTFVVGAEPATLV